MTPEELRAWLRENLEVSVEHCDRFCQGNDVYVGLKFKGDEDEFTYARIYIPEAP